MPRYNTIQDFWDRCIVKDSGCWEWSMKVTPSGYGVTHFKGKEIRAHRLAYQATYNNLPKMVLHRCDNRVCCNPFHLFGGNHKDNMEDMATKGRAAKGVQVCTAKLDKDKVLEIRELHAQGRSTRILGEIYNVHPSTIRRCVSGKNWKHI